LSEPQTPISQAISSTHGSGSGRETGTLATRPVVLLAISGFDPTCASGLGRDVLTAAARFEPARPVWPVAIATALTEQGPEGVRDIGARPADVVADAVARALDQAPMRGAGVAVKIGMLATPATAAAVAKALSGFAGPIVLDPVLRASRGGSLFAGEARALMPAIAAATVITPNADEAAVLTGEPVAGRADAERAARALTAAGARAVLLKGGHLAGDGEVADLLLSRDDRAAQWLSGARVPGVTPRGTGCALATALAIELGRGAGLAEAAVTARTWLAGRIAAATTDLDGQRRLG